MKRFLIVPFCLVLLVSCGGQKTNNTEEDVPASAKAGKARKAAKAGKDAAAPDEDEE